MQNTWIHRIRQGYGYGYGCFINFNNHNELNNNTLCFLGYGGYGRKAKVVRTRVF